MHFLVSLGRLIAAAGFAAILLPHPLQAETVAEALTRGDAPAARVALEAEVKGDPEADLLRAQLEGIIAMRAGDFAKAATIFQGILKVAPGYEPARLQLYRALDRMGQRQEAMTHARRIAATTDDRNLRDALLSQIARDRNARPGGVALRFSLLPSTNITGGARTSTVVIGGVPFELDPASREAAGIGISVGATAWRSFEIARDWRATLSGSVDARMYDTNLRADETDLGLRFDLSRRWARGNISFGPRLAVLFQDGTEARRQVGFGLSADLKLNRRLWLGVSAETLDQRFAGADFRRGTKSTASVGLRWAATPSIWLTGELSGARETALAKHLAHSDLGLGLGVETQLRGGTVFGADVFVSRNTYDGDFPGFSAPRRDNVKSVSLSVRDPRISWRGVTPEFSVTRKRQASNIPIHDTWTTDFGLSFSKRF